MRNFKFGVWIFCIFLVQTAVLSGVHVYDAIPSLVLPFTICAALMQEDFMTTAVISGICALTAGAFTSHSYIVTVLYIFYASILVYALKSKPLYVNRAVKAFVWTFILSGLMEMIFRVIDAGTLTTNALLYSALPFASVNTAFVIIIYPLLKRTMYKEDKKKLLIGDLV